MQPHGRKRKADEAVKEEPAIFAGMHFVFWQRVQMQVMMKRVRDLGGEIEDCVSLATTHVVFKEGMSAEQVAERLLKCPDGRECKEVTVRGHVVLKLPVGLQIVSDRFIVESIKARSRQQEEKYLPPVLQPAPQPPPQQQLPSHPRQAAPAEQQQQQQVAAEQQQRQGAPEVVGGIVRGAARAADSSTSTVPFSQDQLACILQDVSSTRTSGELLLPASNGGAPVGAAAAVAAAAAAAALNAEGRLGSVQLALEPAGPEPSAAAAAAAGAGAGAATQGGEAVCKVVRRGSEFICVRGSKPRFTGGRTNIPWGTGGVWEEPVDEAAARETVTKVRELWFRNSRTGPNPQEEAGGAAAVARADGGNGVCSHPACARRSYCLLQRLDGFRPIYQSRKEQFKLKALEKALGQLRRLTHALDSSEDVNAVGLGAKAAIKVKEILASGGSARVEAAAADPRRQILNLFSEVWGAGNDTAERWYQEGCRTLKDVAAREDLTEQQQVGVKYYDDILRKIPRAEIAEVEKIARCCIFELAEAWGAAAEGDVEFTYAHATGSYRRGKPESSDIDILACLPPSLSGRDCGAFLTQLLAKLLRVGLLTRDLDPCRPHSPSEECATWMGICKPPGSPCFRRIDVKVYASGLAPFAVNYFCNSQNFCRATRHWANVKAREQAQKVHSNANGFKLSDKGLFPRFKRGWGGDKEETILGQGVECKCETDIFEHIGLTYVPPTLRFFNELTRV